MKTHFKITNSHSLYPTKYTQFKFREFYLFATRNQTMTLQRQSDQSGFHICITELYWGQGKKPNGWWECLDDRRGKLEGIREVTAAGT
jgi:hypothetical protein